MVKQVVVRPSGPMQKATADNAVTGGAVVRTGAESRAELTFADQAIARLGANSALQVGDAGLTLDSGALLLDAPAASTTGLVRTGAINIDGRRATAIIERYGSTYAKILILQGTARVFLPATVGESMLLKSGQMVIMKPNAVTLAEPVDYDIGQLYRTSVLIGREFDRLTSQPQIANEIAKQRENAKLVPTNLVINGRGTLVTLATSAKPKGGGTAKPAASPTPASTPRR
ncbi:MAG TPA: FecR domain-containing protein [Chthoniobacterales bacterium]